MLFHIWAVDKDNSSYDTITNTSHMVKLENLVSFKSSRILLTQLSRYFSRKQCLHHPTLHFLAIIYHLWVSHIQVAGKLKVLKLSVGSLHSILTFCL